MSTASVEGGIGGRLTHKSCALEQVEAQLDNNVVFVAQDSQDLASDPPAGSRSARKSGAAGIATYFFMTSTLTFFMSTFWLNSGGNLVCRSSFASTLAAILMRWKITEGAGGYCEERNVSHGVWKIVIWLGCLRLRKLGKSNRILEYEFQWQQRNRCFDHVLCKPTLTWTTFHLTVAGSWRTCGFNAWG